MKKTDKDSIFDLLIIASVFGAIRKFNQDRSHATSKISPVWDILGNIIGAIVGIGICVLLVDYLWVLVLLLIIGFVVLFLYSCLSRRKDQKTGSELEYGKNEETLSDHTVINYGKENSSVDKGKIKLFVIFGIVIVVAAIVITLICENSKKEALLELAETNFSEDFELHLKSLSTYAVKIEGSYIFKEQFYKNGTLNITCNVIYKSDDISKYSNVEFNDARAKTICHMVKRVNKAKNNNDYYKYSCDKGDVIIKIVGSADPLFDIVIHSTGNHTFSYYNSVGWDTLKIDGEIVYLNKEG